MTPLLTDRMLEIVSQLGLLTVALSMKAYDHVFHRFALLLTFGLLLDYEWNTRLFSDQCSSDDANMARALSTLLVSTYLVDSIWFFARNAGGYSAGGLWIGNKANWARFLGGVYLLQGTNFYDNTNALMATSLFILSVVSGAFLHDDWAVTKPEEGHEDHHGKKED